VKVVTGFDPAVHGFRFTNRFHGSAVLSQLGRTGRLGEVTGLGVPRIVQQALGLIGGTRFWDGFGLCGGMSWLALDRFDAGDTPEEEAEPPTPGTALFERLVARQADSLAGTDLVVRCLGAQVLHDHDRWWLFWRDSLGALTEKLELPRLLSGLDAGRPESVCLIRTSGASDPGANHQVVATGYEDLGDGRVTLSLYDPNHPRAAPTITLSTGQPGHRIVPVQSSGETVRGLFVWPRAGR
jgi:hypothetical protein